MTDNLIGQEQAVKLLQRAVALKRIAPAYLFAGTPGIGKSLAARSFAQLIFCHDVAENKHFSIHKRLQTGNYPDFLWVMPTYLHQGELVTEAKAAEIGLKRKSPPQIRIEQIREIAQFVSRPPLESSRLVVIIEDAHTMAESAANALLKTLEEPGKAVIILIAPDANSLLSTLVSRCQQIKFNSLSQTDLTKVLQDNGYGEILEYPNIMAIAQGSPGKAIAAFDRLKTIPEGLHQKLLQVPQNSLAALQLAKAITQELDTQTQLWLIDYLQYYYWQLKRKVEVLEKLSKARQYLLSYVQPRLVWECTLLNILHQYDKSRLG
ncbi:MAG: DNA polymerase III subunit delta' [Xenococcaceae cyanobacterium MO_188.B32]|nr:DNA polymerase III subunit delta' [Xenococcaceae cyanobacterium MO_188.B32]